MKLRSFKTLWGYPFPPSTGATVEYYDTMCLMALSQGYYGLEAITLTFRDPLFIVALKKHQLRLIVQLHTTGGYLNETGYVYCKNRNVSDHVESLKSQVAEVEALGLGDLLCAINVHSGHDSWAHTDKAVEFFTAVENLPCSVPVYHETHRQRTLYSPYSYDHLTNVKALPDLRFNLDISHWVCVCEHVFDTDDEERDGFFQPILSKLAQNCDMIHARIGFDEGPQVNDPRSPEHKGAVEAHLKWWKEVWRGQKKRGLEESFVTMEFGPAPYMPCYPNSNETPVSNLEDVNMWMKEQVETAYSEVVGSRVSGDADMTVLSEAAIRKIATNEMAFEACEVAFKALSNNEVQSPVPVQLAFPDRGGETCIKPGFVTNNDYYVVKVASGFQKNQEDGVSNGSGVSMVFSARTGFPQMVLADNGFLTDKRTAAAACVCAKTLCKKGVSGGVTVGVVGCGIMAKAIIEMITDVLEVKEFKCWSRTAANVAKMVGELAKGGVVVSQCDGVRECISKCDVVISCTASKVALIERDMLRDDATLVCLGSDTPGKREVGDSVVDHIWDNGGKVVCDTKENVVKLGEMQWHGERVWDEDKCVSFGDVLTGKKGGRKGGEMILCDLTGVGAQDAAIGNEVVKAYKKG